MGGSAPSPAHDPDHESQACEVSVVMPCLNEADTLEICIRKAQRAFREHQIAGEVIVADNGSTDGSQEIAKRVGARLVSVPRKGYGSCLMGGIDSARGRYIVMADADDSYDFLETPKFVRTLSQGHDLVQGCRLPSGGGRVKPGAMPFTHRWIGNPVLTFIARLMFGIPVRDIYCGFRGFTKALYERLDLRCGGMEFATEMIIKSALFDARIAEIPITLHPDGRKVHGPHLKTLRDGWRTVRFFLLSSPRWLFLFPGVLLIGLGSVGYYLTLPDLVIEGARFDVHTLLLASLSILCGYASILFALFAKTFAVTEGLLPPDRSLQQFFRFATLEVGLVISSMAVALGGGLLLFGVDEWRSVGSSTLNDSRSMRMAIPGFTLVFLGFQTILSSFFVSILGMNRK